MLVPSYFYLHSPHTYRRQHYPPPFQVVKVYASSFQCMDIDPLQVMSASLTVDCDSDLYTQITMTAIISMLTIPTLTFAVFYFFVLSPVAPYIEARTKRGGVSPFVDFLVAKWKPTKWHFALVDIVRLGNSVSMNSPMFIHVSGTSPLTITSHHHLHILGAARAVLLWTAPIPIVSARSPDGGCHQRRVSSVVSRGRSVLQ